MLSDKAEEILETLWISFEEKKLESFNVEKISNNDNEFAIKELINSDSITINGNNNIKLTEKGKVEGKDMVRRHRLAERLLLDVLDVKGKMINESACEFEHLLHKGIDDHICTILGHPRVCPHGKPIPPGECCEKKTSGLRIISSLSELSPGENGKIAYIHAKDQDKLQKLMAMGVLPGIEIKLLQSFPSYLFKLGNSQFAVDESIADEIFVRISDK